MVQRTVSKVERIDKILNHDLFKGCVAKNAEAEKERVFCHHDMVHFLDVARIGWILNLEEEAGLPKDMIYGAALLHDIGRHIQYKDGTKHAKASTQIAPVILRECGYTEDEQQEILEAIASHSDSSVRKEKGLRGILYRADKLSRPCFVCPAEDECNWKQDKKNKQLNY